MHPKSFVSNFWGAVQLSSLAFLLMYLCLLSFAQSANGLDFVWVVSPAIEVDS